MNLKKTVGRKGAKAQRREVIEAKKLEMPACHPAGETGDACTQRLSLRLCVFASKEPRVQ